MAVLDVPSPTRHLSRRLSLSIRGMHRRLPMSTCSVPAPALCDAGVAAWVRAHGVTVFVAGADELQRTCYAGIRAEHIVLRCGVDTSTIRAAVAAGVTRFVVSSDRHVDVLASTDRPEIAVYLDEAGPAVIGERRLAVIGLHAAVDDGAGAVEWGMAAERLLCRTAILRTCGLPLARIFLTGGDVSGWLHSGAAVAGEVDDALTEGCARWRLARPSVLLGAAT